MTNLSPHPEEAQPEIDRTIWLADLTYTQQQISAELIPQAIGGIATYAEARLHLSEPIRLFKYPEKLAEALASDGCPDIIGFSNYVWNTRLSLAFARRIRELSADTIIVFGGPHYPILPEEQKAYLASTPEIDFFLVKESELPFVNLITALCDDGANIESVKAQGLASVHAIGRDGRVHMNQTIDRLRDLSEIPSPYTTGKLDEFFDGKLLPIIQTNRGCPFSCTFCVEGVSYYNKIHRSTPEKVRGEIDYIGRKMIDARQMGGRNDLFIADSNFGMYKDDLGTCQEIAKAQDAYDWPEYINVATGKNQKARVLEGARLVRGALRLSGSVQSLDSEVLKNVKRDNIASDDLMKLALEASDIDANSYSEVILGLPGDTREAHFRTLETIVAAGFRKVVPYTLMMLPGSEMCTNESKSKYGMELRFRILPRCFGHFDICGKRVVSAEVEEVCVGTHTLPYEDYVACRKLHLMISTFYNDGVFSGLLKFLENLDVSLFRWLVVLTETTPPKRLKPVIDAFEQSTRTELWKDRAELEAFIEAPGVIERYIAGELGLNLLFTYKSIAMTRYIEELSQLARQAVEIVLSEKGLNTDTNLAFVDDILKYDVGRMQNLFDEYDQTIETAFDFDVISYLCCSDNRPVTAFRFDHPTSIRFVLDSNQRDTIARALALFGSDDAGIGRILSKFHITKLLRQPTPDHTNASNKTDETAQDAVAGRMVSSPINFHDT